MDKMTDKTDKLLELVRKIALQNALLHDGKASEKAVIGKLLAYNPSFKSRIQNLLEIISEETEKVNSLNLKQQKDEIIKNWPQLLQIKKTRVIHELPPLPDVDKYKNALQKFCFFVIAFGIWDIFYYIWLWVMVGWPESLMTWDLLFFVPLPWVGPVITPVLIALTMAIAGSLIIYYEEKGCMIAWRWYDWVIELGCGSLMIVAFCWDWKNIIRLPGGVPYTGIPNPFAWWLYLPAYIFSVVYFVVRLRQIFLAGADLQRGDRA